MVRHLGQGDRRQLGRGDRWNGETPVTGRQNFGASKVKVEVLSLLLVKLLC